MLLKKKIFRALTLSVALTVGASTTIAQIESPEAKAADNEIIKTQAGTDVNSMHRTYCYNKTGEEKAVEFEVTHQPLMTSNDHS